MEDNFVIVGLKENELELELGLSIGGSFKRVEKLKPIKKDPARNRTSDLDLREKSQALVVEQESTPVNPRRKREIQAMRRQEAMKKREEKQQKRGLSRGQKAEFRSKENDRETQDSERKKKKVEFSGSLAGETENANQNSSRSQNPSHSVGLNPPMCSVIPVRGPCSCPYQQVQYGFVYPCGTAPPCWGGGGSGNERNVGEQAVNQGLRPFHGCQNPASGFESDPNSTKDERNWKSGSTGSPMCSSSVVSDLQSSPNQGGCSSDIGTHSINSCQPEHPQMNRSSTASNQKGQLEETAQSIDSPTINVNAGVSGPSQSKGLGPTVEGEPGCCNDKPSVAPANSATAMEERHVEWTTSKRPGNYLASSNGNGNATLPLPYMPCVSATGDGPNGKTVNGFLYRYTQAEVSIVCVCHGSLLSPAEFVQHAGVTDVSHPLRHITVIPSAF